MMEQNKRLYIGNLPEGVSDADIRERFGVYGKIASLEVKNKKASDGNVLSTFAFLELTVSDRKLTECLSCLNGSNISGSNITVQVAKESFLSKLKAERENPKKPESENSKKSAPALPLVDLKAEYDPLQIFRNKNRNAVQSDQQSFFKKGTDTSDVQNGNSFNGHMKENKKKKFKEEDLKEDENAVGSTGSLMNKLETHHNMWNDLDSAPVLLDETKKIPKEFTPVVQQNEDKVTEKDSKYVDPKKRELDNQKRIQSLQDRNKARQAQHLQIKSALSLTDNQKNKKTFFDDEDESTVAKSVKEEKKKVELFQDDYDQNDDADQFKLRPHLDGKTGHELLDLQTRYGNDSRFKLDQRFAEQDIYEETEESADGEVNRQMSILSSMVNMAPSVNRRDHNQVKSKSFVRYDPKIEEHTKFEKEAIPQPVKDLKRKGKREDFNNKHAEQPVQPLPEVSAERYYTTTTALNIGSQTGGFSLRSLFQSQQPDAEMKEPVVEEPVAKPVSKVEQKTETNQQDKSTGYWKNAGMWHESLFVQSNDPRLREAMQFLNKKADDEYYRDKNLWPDHRDRLVRFYKNKMRRCTSYSTGVKRSIETADESAHLYKSKPEIHKKSRMFFKK